MHAFSCGCSCVCWVGGHCVCFCGWVSGGECRVVVGGGGNMFLKFTLVGAGGETRVLVG